MEAYHNEGFFKAALLIVFLLVPGPLIIGYLSWGNEWVNTYMAMFHDKSNCWENSRHEMICKETANCKFGRNFCD